MSEVTASVRVRSDAQDSVRPTRSRIEEAAAALRSHGFDVLHLGRFSISVRGLAPLFERELGVALRRNEPVKADLKPHAPDLAQLVQSLEIAPEPELFQKSGS